MSRRSMSPAARAEYAYWVRLRYEVPPGGLGMRKSDILAWINANVTQGGEVHPAKVLGGSGIAVYLHSLEDATAFAAAFPDLIPADVRDL